MSFGTSTEDVRLVFRLTLRVTLMTALSGVKLLGYLYHGTKINNYLQMQLYLFLTFFSDK